jgi:hypothetical protein
MVCLTAALTWEEHVHELAVGGAGGQLLDLGESHLERVVDPLEVIICSKREENTKRDYRQTHRRTAWGVYGGRRRPQAASRNSRYRSSPVAGRRWVGHDGP